MSGKDLRAGGLERVTIEDIIAPGFSTPWDAPMTPPFPITFRNVEVLTLAWRTSEAAVARLLPPPLEPSSDVVLAHIYRMGDAEWLGAYGEANVSIGCRLPRANIADPIRRICFCPRMSAWSMAGRCMANRKSPAIPDSRREATSWSARCRATASIF